MGGDGRGRSGRLGQDDPGPERHEVGAFQHRPLGTLDVDLEEVDVVRRVEPADLGQGAHRHHHLAHAARPRVSGGDRGVERRQPGAVERVQHRLARGRTQRQLQRHVARPGGADMRRLGLERLDVHARPAAVVEGAGDAVGVRVLRAHIDVEAALDRAERPPQQDVLEVLGIRDERHGAPGTAPCSNATVLGARSRMCCAERERSTASAAERARREDREPERSGLLAVSTGSGERRVGSPAQRIPGRAFTPGA